MRAFFKPTATKIALFVLGSIVLGALLSPIVYHVGQNMVEAGTLKGGWLQGIHDSMERATFARYFNRSLTLAAVLLLWPTIRWIRRDQPEKDDRGFLLLEKNPRRWIHLLIGFFVACGTLLLLGYIYTKTGVYDPRDPEKALSRILINALTSAIAVAFLEEYIFRGALMALILRTAKPKVALVFLTAFFAFIHFLQPPKTKAFETVLKTMEVDWTSGFWIMGQIFGQFGNPTFFLAEFTVLFAVGLILGYSRLKTKSLWLGIGLHAGWVFGIKFFSPFTRLSNDAKNIIKAIKGEGKEDMVLTLWEKIPWYGDSLRSGLNSALVVTFSGILIWLWLKYREVKNRDAFEDYRNNG